MIDMTEKQSDKPPHADAETWARYWTYWYERHTKEAAEAKKLAEEYGAVFTPSHELPNTQKPGVLATSKEDTLESGLTGRRDGHAALRVKDGKLETFDPHPESAPSTTPRSETPRTDAVALGVAKYSNDDVKLREALAHGRDLERELAEVREGLRYSDAENDELRQENGALSAASATACSADAAMLENYAKSYDGMGDISGHSVAYDIRHNMIPALRRPDGGKQTDG